MAKVKRANKYLRPHKDYEESDDTIEYVYSNNRWRDVE